MTRVPGITNVLFGQDGYYLVALTGPGQIWLQSMPIPNLAHALAPYIAQQISMDTQAPARPPGRSAASWQHHAQLTQHFP